MPQVQKNLATVDHIIPRSVGGADAVDNMFVMCRSCNSDRGDQCFAEYVTSKGVSKYEADRLYKKAHVVTLQIIIANQFNTNNFKDPQHQRDLNRIKRKQVNKVIENYTSYFGDYLPEFELLQRVLKQ